MLCILLLFPPKKCATSCNQLQRRVNLVVDVLLAFLFLTSLGQIAAELLLVSSKAKILTCLYTPPPHCRKICDPGISSSCDKSYY